MSASQCVVVLAAFLSASTGYAFGPVEAEKSQLLERIQCARQSTTPAGDGLGALWGCYTAGEDVKLWINSRASSANVVQNIKLAAVVPNGSKPPIAAKLWSRVVAETYAPDQAAEIADAFLNCDGDARWQSEEPAREIALRCHQGPGAKEHALIIQSR